MKTTVDNLLDLKKMADELYIRHTTKLLTLNEYLELLRPIDEAIDSLEMKIFSNEVSSCNKLCTEEINYN